MAYTNCEAPKFASEEALIASMLERDPRAWREFDARYARLIQVCIRRVMRRFSAITHSEDAEEVRARLFVGLVSRDMHKLRVFDATRGVKLSSWVGRLASNAAWDHLRSKGAEPLWADLGAAHSIPDPDQDPHEALCRDEQIQSLTRALEGLSPQDREFVNLYFVHGADPEEIASELAISVKTVYSRKHKIQSRLRREISRMMTQSELASAG